MKKIWGFDTRDMDTGVRPQDDFYHYANGGWMKRNPIPKTESRWGSFTKLRFDTEKQLHVIVEELANKKKATRGTPEQMVGDFYRSAMDMKTRNARGLSPLKALRTEIRNVSSVEELISLLPKLHLIGVGAFWNTAIDQDAKQSTAYRLHVVQDGLGMPDRDYYLAEDAESVRVRRAYRPYVATLLTLMGVPEADAKRDAHEIICFETALAQISMKKEDRRDAEKTYHKMSVAALQKHAPQIPWKKYFAQIGAKTGTHVIVMQPKFIRGMAKLLTHTPLSTLKKYAEFQLVNDYASTLGERYVKHVFSFYGTTLTGVTQMKPLWRRALASVNGSLGELLGQVYVQRHFPKAAKEKMLVLVADLFEAYEARIRVLPWMSPKTRRFALKKLHAMTRKIGYPDVWKSYKGLRVEADTYTENIMRSAAFEHHREMRKLGKPIDRKEWFMTPQTVNAYCAFSLNDIVFPAGILQPPFFSLAADDALNYGAIGAVIGHEITHAFDDQGSKFDEKGNMKSWWTKEDRARFMKKAKQVEKQYDAFTVADGVHVNGKLTLGENIADFGGLAIAYDAYQLRLAKTGRRDIGGFTPEERFYLGFALFERENERPEFIKTQVKTDPHSPGQFRINGPLSNFEAFYDTYKVSPGDALYRDTKDRVRIW